MAYGNYQSDPYNANEQQKALDQQRAQAAEMERRRQEQMAYDRQRQAFQEQVVSQEQARKKSETDNQYKVGMAATNSKKDLVDSMVRGGLFNAFAPFRQSLVN